MGELIPGTVFAGYRIEALAGRGGMGVVYRATELGLGRTVALKVIGSGFLRDDAARERFLRESRLAASIDHPNVIPVFAAGEEQGVAYIAMRYVPGEDLAALVRREGRLAAPRALFILGQVASALQATHELGLVHRDVKPANVLLDGNEHAYLTDFGLTKSTRVQDGVTRTGEWVGTPDFASPEQILGDALDARSDVYALGCLHFYLLTGHAPHERGSTQATLWAHVHEPPPPLSEFVSQAPAGLDEVIGRALAKRSGDRYASAIEFARAAAAAAANVQEVGDGRDPPATIVSASLVPARPTPETTGRLPVPPTTLHGRTDDLRRIERAAGRRGLLTLVGPGGVGKTRLAIETARVLGAQFEDGARFVALAPLSEPRGLASAITLALQAPLRQGEHASNALLRFLSDRELLLVLDNFEHVLAGTPLVGDLLAECSRVMVMITSREPTGLAAERLYPVRPLEVPVDDEAISTCDLEASGAVSMFCDRARARDPEFTLDADTGRAVGEICRRLDGLPLALELAAARIGVLSVAELADRLRGALSVLGTGPSDAPARQRTLRATIDWSYNLLNDSERRAFAHMAVFVAGTAVAVAETVTGAELDTLDSLVAKQLLQRRGDRLHMLETVRAYAAERLAEDPDADTIRLRLATWVAAFAGEAAPHLVRADRRAWLRRLEAEIPNALAALSWALDHEHPDLALSIAGRLGEYWWNAPRWEEGRASIDAALARTPHAAPLLRAETLLYRARLSNHRDLPARECLEAALELFRACDDAAGMSACLGELALCERWAGHDTAARRLSDEAIRVAEREGDERAIAAALTYGVRIGTLYDDTARRAHAAVAVAERTGDLLAVDLACSVTGYLAIAEDRPHEAVTWLERGLAAAERNENPRSVFFLATNLGLARLFLDQVDGAAQAFSRSLAICETAAELRAVDETLLGLAAVAARRGDFADAGRLAGAAESHRSDFRAREEATVWARLQQIVAGSRERHGADTWDRAAHEGAALTVREAVAVGLAYGTD